MGGAVVAERAFNPAMFRLGRDRLGLQQVELASRAGVTQALVSKMENGLIGQPSDEAMQRLSEVMHLPVSFFYQEDKAIGLPHFHYRKRAKLGAKPLAQIEAIINIRRQHVAKLLRSYEIEVARPIPQIDLDERGITPERVAEQLREYWVLPRGPVTNLVELIEEAGGIVILAKFGTALLDGVSFRVGRLPPLFFMNKDMPGDRFRFSLAHELGHMVLHAIPDDDQKMEDEAHRFAAAFLMPTRDIKPYLDAPQLSTLGRVKAFWKVSIKALIKRANDLKLITPSQYKTLNVQYSKSFKGEEPLPIGVEEPSRLKEIVRYHRDVLGYSLADLAELLCILPSDVEQHYLNARPGLRLVVSNTD